MPRGQGCVLSVAAVFLKHFDCTQEILKFWFLAFPQKKDEAGRVLTPTSEVLTLSSYTLCLYLPPNCDSGLAACGLRSRYRAWKVN